MAIEFLYPSSDASQVYKSAQYKEVTPIVFCDQEIAQLCKEPTSYATRLWYAYGFFQLESDTRNGILSAKHDHIYNIDVPLTVYMQTARPDKSQKAHRGKHSKKKR